MARPLPNHPIQNLHFISAPFAFFIVLTSIFSVFSLITFLCGSHKLSFKSLKFKDEKKTVRLGEKNNSTIKKLQSRLSSKAKMISWRKVTNDEEVKEFEYEEEEDDDVVWKKTIIKGEKCRPLDFSGKILYDSDGNLLPDL